ncbi:MAG TPA: hypothetical protein VM243_16360 [Phycisphaerae bacterium]|nr:hypothetical protein [Phycisphaerae bacterium]
MALLDFDLACIWCNASLHGADVAGLCPRCNHKVGDTLDPALLDPDTLAVARDVPCVACQYNLRTLPAGSLCPECARPVADSLRPRELHYADLRWLRRVRGGVTRLFVAMIALLLAVLILVVAQFPVPFFATLLIVIGMILGVIALFFAVVGVFLATASVPNDHASRGVRAARIAARVLLLWPVVSVAGRLLGIPPLFWALSRLPLMAAPIMAVPCVFVALRHVAGFGRSPALARAMTVMICLIIAGIVLAFTSIGLWWLTAGPPVVTTTTGPGGTTIATSVVGGGRRPIVQTLLGLARGTLVLLALVGYALGGFVLANCRGLLTKAIQAAPKPPT